MGGGGKGRGKGGWRPKSEAQKIFEQGDVDGEATKRVRCGTVASS
jgi:hypothetical protein